MSTRRGGGLAGLIPAAPEAVPALPSPPSPPPDSGGTNFGTPESGRRAPAAAAAESVASVPRKSRPRNSRTAEVRSSEIRTPEVPDSKGPKYLQLERKDTLLWPRQLNELTVLRRVLNRRKPKGEGERITENTLIRLAIDLLMANADRLQGSNEEDLRRSLGLRD